MNVIERFNKAIEFNAANPQFAPIDDEFLGTRINGGFVSDIIDNGNPCRCFVFDNGDHFVFDINETIMAKWKGNTNNEYYRTEPMKKVLKYKFQYV